MPMLMLFVIGVLIHESGHALAAKMLGFKILGFGFGVCGPYVRVRGNHNRGENLTVALSGPLANCVAGLALFFAHMPASGFLMAMIGLVMLLPLPGSDGWNACLAIWGKV